MPQLRVPILFREQPQGRMSPCEDVGLPCVVRRLPSRCVSNWLQEINRYQASGAHATRLDVTILVHGLPMVHVELKRRGVNIREAFKQINRYQHDSFWPIPASSSTQRHRRRCCLGLGPASAPTSSPGLGGLPK